jgi:hypothetical protein
MPCGILFEKWEKFTIKVICKTLKALGEKLWPDDRLGTI